MNTPLFAGFFLLLMNSLQAQINCNAEFSYNAAGNDVYFVNISTGVMSHQTTYSWDFGDQTTSNEVSPVHHYNYGSFNVCLTMQDLPACNSTTCHLITIHGIINCQASFTFQTDPVSFEHLFTNTSTGTTDSTQYFWDFGDGNTSSDKNPKHLYANPGTYQACLQIGDHTTGCISHFCQPVSLTHTDYHLRTLVGVAAAISQSKSSDLLNKIQNISINPNPVYSNSVLNYILNEDTPVVIGIYDSIGNRLHQDFYTNRNKGSHSDLINTYALRSGIYYIKIQTNNESYTKMFSVVK